MMLKAKFAKHKRTTIHLKNPKNIIWIVRSVCGKIYPKKMSTINRHMEKRAKKLIAIELMYTSFGIVEAMLPHGML